MGKYEHSIMIDRPTGDVFRFIANYTANVPQWQTGTGKITIVPEGNLRVGSMVTHERRAAGIDLLLNADVIDYQPGKVVALKGVIGRYPFQDTYTFAAQGRSTKLTLLRITPSGFIARLLSPFFGMRMNRLIPADLERLKAAIEGS